MTWKKKLGFSLLALECLTPGRATQAWDMKVAVRSLPKDTWGRDHKGLQPDFTTLALNRSLYRWDQNKGKFVPDLAKTCSAVSKLHILCQLRPGQEFTNGDEIEALHFVHFFSSRKAMTKASTLDFLEDLKADSKDRFKIHFHLRSPLPDFHPFLADGQVIPMYTPQDQLSFDPAQTTSGSYQLTKKKETQIVLKLRQSGPSNTGNDPPDTIELNTISSPLLVERAYTRGLIDATYPLPLSGSKSSTLRLRVPVARLDHLSMSADLAPEERLQLWQHFPKATLNAFWQISETGAPVGCFGIDSHQRICKADSPKQKGSEPRAQTKLFFAVPAMTSADHRNFANLVLTAWSEITSFEFKLIEVPHRLKIETTKRLSSRPHIQRLSVIPSNATCEASRLELVSMREREGLLTPFSERAQKSLQGHTSCEDWLQESLREGWVIPLGGLELEILASGRARQWLDFRPNLRVLVKTH